MTLAPCERCNQRVAVLGWGPDGRRRLHRHKRTRPHQGYQIIDWCPGQYERKEVKR